MKPLTLSPHSLVRFTGMAAPRYSTGRPDQMPEITPTLRAQLERLAREPVAWMPPADDLDAPRVESTMARGIRRRRGQ